MDITMKNDRIELEDALALIRSHTPSPDITELELEALSGEILAEPVRALHDQPPFPRSPLDGYAIRGSDSTGASCHSPVTLRVIGKLCAGDGASFQVNPGEAVRIMTGARIPDNATAVIRQEDTDLGMGQVRLYASVKDGQNYCQQGEDYRSGDLLLKSGSPLSASAIALLASNGISRVRVYRKPRVAIITTGDELVPAGTPLSPGKIYNTNRYMLQARLRELGVDSITVHVPDRISDVMDALEKCINQADVCITTGGVSVGEKDIMHDVLKDSESQIIFRGIRLKPGSPAHFALLHETPVLALSGNPFAASATFEILGRMILHLLSGGSISYCHKVRALLKNDFPKSSPQRRFIRAFCMNTEHGRTVSVPAHHGSGQIASLNGCNCMIDIPAGSDPLRAGSDVCVWLL